MKNLRSLRKLSELRFGEPLPRIHVRPPVTKIWQVRAAPACGRPRLAAVTREVVLPSKLACHSHRMPIATVGAGGHAGHAGALWQQHRCVDAITAWIALSPITADSVVMRMVASRHEQAVLAHVRRRTSGAPTSHGQRTTSAVDVFDAAQVAAQLSQHHQYAFSHASRSRPGSLRAQIDPCGSSVTP